MVFKDVLGLAPKCFIISAADLLPMSPHSLIGLSFTKPYKKPEANKSPAPVVSTTFVTLIGSIEKLSWFLKTIEPFEPKVIAPTSTFSLISIKLCSKLFWKRLVISTSFAKIISTFFFY